MQQTLHRLSGISLREILPECRIAGDVDIRVTSCCGDSRRLMPGDLFVAIVGSRRDGHDYAQEAVGRGAGAILAERPLAVGVPTCVVPDTRRAYGRLCQSLSGDPSKHLRVIGITGTNGKTTTEILVASVLQAAGAQVGLMGTLGYCDSAETAHGRRTTPAAPELARWLARMHANGCSHAVVEMSSRALARHRTAGIELDAAVLTNVRRDHLDDHGSVLNYRKAKARLFDQLRPEGFAVVNADDPASRRILSKLDHPVLTIGMKFPAEITATVVERHKSEQTFLLDAGSETVPVRTRMIGDHHIYNCMAASAVGLLYGIDLPAVVRGLESVEFVPGRLERIECGQPFGAFVDYAHTPDALAVSLKAVRRVTEGRLICVFGADAKRNPENRPLLGRVVERGADLGVITNDNPRTCEPLRIVHDILDGYERPARAHVLPDRAEAICWALGQARPGDTVLIAGKGDRSWQIVGENRYYFDDREIVRSWLYETATKTN